MSNPELALNYCLTPAEVCAAPSFIEIPGQTKDELVEKRILPQRKSCKNLGNSCIFSKLARGRAPAAALTMENKQNPRVDFRRFF